MFKKINIKKKTLFSNVFILSNLHIFNFSTSRQPMTKRIAGKCTPVATLGLILIHINVFFFISDSYKC